MQFTKYQFSLQIWVIIIGILLLRIGTTVSIPFLSIFLHFKAGLSLPLTGFIVGVSYLSYVAGGVFAGVLSDKHGRRKIFSVSLALYALTFFGFGAAASFIKSPLLIGCVFCGLNLIGGLFRIWSETLGQAMLSDLASDEQKVAVFSLRYTAMNIGSAIGPVLGAISGFSGTMAGFYLTGIMCLAYFTLFVFVSREITKNIDYKPEHITFSKTVKTLLNDKALMYFITGGMFAYLVYVQQESTLGQILMQRFGDPKLFAMLLTLNAIIVICLQISLTNYCMREDKHPLSMMKLGCVFLCCGLLGAALSGMHYVFYPVSQVIFTLGEMLIFPLGGIFIDSIAPKELRGAYFGTIGFQYLGRAVGPLLGGCILQGVSGKITLIIFAILALVTMFFYHKGAQLKEVRS